MNNKFPEGTLVYAIARPGVRLMIRRYLDRRYYCREQKDPTQKELIYFERELTTDPSGGANQ